MSIPIGELVFPIIAEDQFSDVFVKANSGALQLSNAWRRVGWDLSRAGLALTPFSAAIGAIGAASLKAAADFESGFAGVLKTISDDLTEFEKQDLAKGFRQLSLEIPKSADELTRIGEIAGQLGIEVPNILGFTRVMADLSVATADLSAEEAADKLARFTNVARNASGVTVQSVENFQRLGSALTHLGNNFATTEGEIIKLATRIAGTGNLVGLSQHEILGYAAALSAVGIRAEMGGTAISKEFLIISQAVSEGGKKLQQFADIASAGMVDMTVTAEEFAERFRANPAEAVLEFVTGLHTIKESGGDVAAVFRELNINEVRLRETMAKMTSAADLVGEALALSKEGWEDGNKLIEEAEKRYETLTSMLQVFRNHIRYVMTEIGTALIPTFKSLLRAMEPVLGFMIMLAERFAELPEPIRILAAGFVALGAAIAPLLITFGGLAFAIGGLVGPGGALILHLTAMAAKIGAVVSAIAAAGGLVYWLGETSGLLQIIREEASRVYNTLAEIAAPILTQAWEHIKVAVGNVMIAFGELKTAITNVISSFAESQILRTIIASTFDAIGAVIMVFINNLHRVGDGLNIVAGGIVVLSRTISNTWSILELFARLVGEAYNAFIRLAAGVARSGVSIYTAVRDVVSNVGWFVGQIYAAVHRVIEAQIALIVDGMQIVGRFVRSVLDGIRIVAGEFGQAFYNTFSGVFNLIFGLFSSAGDSVEGFSNKSQEAAGGISKAFRGMYESVMEVIKNILTSIVTIFPTLQEWADRIDKVGDRLDRLAKYAKAAAQPMGHLHVLAKVLADLQNIGEQQSGGAAAGTGFTEKVTEIVEKVKKDFEEAKNGVKKILSALDLQNLMAGLSGGGEAGKPSTTAKLKEEIDETSKAAEDLWKKMSGFNDMVEAFNYAAVFEKANIAGLKLSREALNEMGESARKAIMYLQKMGQDIPPILITLSLETGPTQEELDKIAKNIQQVNDEIYDAQWGKVIEEQADSAVGALLKVGLEYEKAMRRFRDARPLGVSEEAWRALEDAIADGFTPALYKAMEGTELLYEVLLILSTLHPGLLGLLPELLDKIDTKAEDVTKKFKTWDETLDSLSKAFRNMKQTAEGTLGDLVQAIADFIQNLEVANESGKALADGFEQLKSSAGFEGIISGLSQVTSGIMGAVAAMDRATRSTSRWRNALGGAATGAQIGTAIAPGIGTAFGAVIGGLIGAFRKTGPSKAEIAEMERQQAFLQQQTEKLTEAYEKLHGQLNETFGDALSDAKELGIRLPQALLDALQELTTIGQLTEENVKKIQGLTDVAEVDWKKMQEAAEKYGIEMDAMGQQFHQLRHIDLATEIINDYDLLKRGGVEVGTILFAMKDEISDLVNESIKFGTEIPRNMEPWIRHLRDQGLLLDENGDLLEDLSGVKFGDEVKTEFELITDAIWELIDTIKTDLVDAFLAIPRDIDVNINPQWGNPGPPPGYVPDPAEEGRQYATGTLGVHGRWFENYGAGTNAVLHGEEAVVTKAQAPAFAADILGSSLPTRDSSGVIPVRMNILNHEVFAEIVLEQSDDILGLRGLR